MNARKSNPIGVPAELTEPVRRILRDDWNPIGIDALPDDEYDAYIGGVYRMLKSGAREEDLADHLNRIETDWMLCPRDEKAELSAVPRKLLAVVRS
jgi:hypothetical protein